MPLHYHDFITPKSSGNAAIGKAVALGFLFLLVALGDDFFAQANTVGLEVEERAFRYGENLHRTHVTFRQAGIDLIAHIVQGVAGTLQVLIAKRLVVLPSVWRSLAGLRPAFGAFGPGTAADKTLYRLHALIPQMITFPTHLGIYIISQLPEFA